jgi:hypothetical protein
MNRSGDAGTMDRFRDLVHETRLSEAEIMTRAFQVGLRQLWREQILGRYLRGQLSEEEAIAVVGIDWVRLAERQHEAMLEDLEWALRD